MIPYKCFAKESRCTVDSTVNATFGFDESYTTNNRISDTCPGTVSALDDALVVIARFVHVGENASF